MALAMQSTAPSSNQTSAFAAPSRQLPPMDSEPPRRGSITDPLLHAHASLPGSADGVRRGSGTSIDGTLGFGAGAAFSAMPLSSVTDTGRSGSPDRQLSSRDRAPSIPNAQGAAAMSASGYPAGANFGLSYGWPQPTGLASPYLSLKRKSIGMDDASIGADFKRRSSVDGARLASLSLEAEQEELRRRSSTSTNWSSGSSAAYALQPTAQRYSFGPGSDPRQMPSAAIADQLAAYNFGQPGLAGAAPRYAPPTGMPTAVGAPNSALSPTSSRMMGGMALATLAQGDSQSDPYASLAGQLGSTNATAFKADDDASSPGEGSHRSGSAGPRNSTVAALSKETPYSRSPELRVSHKLAERKRRKEMKELFDELRDALPVERGMKNSKWEILAKSVEYIATLKSQQTDLANENELLRSHVAALSTAAASAGVNPGSAAATSAALALGGRSHRGSIAAPDSRRASQTIETMQINRAEADRTPLAAPSEPWPGHPHPSQLHAQQHAQQQQYLQQQRFYQQQQAALQQQHPSTPRQLNGQSLPPSGMHQVSGPSSDNDAYGEPDGPSPNTR